MLNGTEWEHCTHRNGMNGGRRYWYQIAVAVSVGGLEVDYSQSKPLFLWSNLQDWSPLLPNSSTGLGRLGITVD